jgi:hypothetical protein
MCCPARNHGNGPHERQPQLGERLERLGSEHRGSPGALWHQRGPDMSVCVEVSVASELTGCQRDSRHKAEVADV